MANDTIMMNMDDVEKLMEKINQSIVQFIEVRDTLNHGAENFETTLKMLSQNAFKECSTEIKEGFICQYDLLKEARSTGLAIKEMFKDTDTQLAAEITDM